MDNNNPTENKDSELPNKEEELLADIEPVADGPSAFSSTAYNSSVQPLAEPDSGGAADVKPTVVVGQSGKPLPWWFYLLLIILIIAFIVINTLLVFSLKSKMKEQNTPQSLAPSITQSPTQSPQPTPTIPKKDDILLKLQTLTSGDEIADIEKDLDNTEFSGLEQSLSEVTPK